MGLQSKYPSHVSQLTANQRCTLREDKTCLFIKTDYAAELVLVDKGVIPETPGQLMCDYLVYDENRRTAKFIELKGEDVRHACDQIHDSILFFESRSDLQEAVNNMDLIKGYIVSPHCNVPAIEDVKRKKAFRKLYNKSRSKLNEAHDHIVFVRCVTKNPGHRAGQENMGEVIVSNEFPLIV